MLLLHEFYNKKFLLPDKLSNKVCMFGAVCVCLCGWWWWVCVGVGRGGLGGCKGLVH